MSLTWRVVAAATVAGVAAGALAVYVTGAPSGNGVEAPATSQQLGSGEADTAACIAKTDKAKRVGAAAIGDVAAMLAADPPQSLKGLAFNSPEGTPMTLADHSGKTLLINLWATWCAPCRAEMPELDALQKEMGSDTFEVIAVNVDTGGDEKPKKFFEDVGIGSLAFYRESSLALFNDLKKRGLALGLPVTLLVDDDGCLLAHMNGPANWASDDAKRLIESVR
ncbi:redoxin family protein [Mesorhizobium sp. NBSH29]|nr:TlpA disulfide reductase family protein [Mesorhizobium sp. NBSH29]QPC85659.1 redoxin family protein [Mesorhizobium sp. NBSH29]